MNNTDIIISKLKAHIESKLTDPDITLVSSTSIGLHLRSNNDYMVFYFRDLIDDIDCVYSSKGIKSKCDLYFGDPDLLNKLDILVNEFQAQC